MSVNWRKRVDLIGAFSAIITSLACCCHPSSTDHLRPLASTLTTSLAHLRLIHFFLTSTDESHKSDGNAFRLSLGVDVLPDVFSLVSRLSRDLASSTAVVVYAHDISHAALASRAAAEAASYLKEWESLDVFESLLIPSMLLRALKGSADEEGGSGAAAAAVAKSALWKDDGTMETRLLGLVLKKDLAGFKARLIALSGPQMIQELLERLEYDQRAYYPHERAYREEWGKVYGMTAFTVAMCRDTLTLEIAKLMDDGMKDDARKRNLFAILDSKGCLPLHYCAMKTTSVGVLQFVIDKFPGALVSTINGYEVSEYDRMAPLEIAQYERNTHRDNHAAIIRCLEDNLAKYHALENQITVKLCLVRLKSEGMTDFVARTPLNDLTREQFVFMTLDNMQNRAMQPLAEEIVSHVGLNMGLEGSDVK